MAAINKLSAIRVRTAGPGMHGDGGGLWLHVGTGRSWRFRFTFGGRAREMGLGAVSDVSLAQARELAAAARARLQAGVDPIEERRAARTAAAIEARPATTFATAAAALMQAREAGYRNAKHRAQWRSTLETYAYPVLGHLPVGDVSTEHCLAILAPLWAAGKVETGSRLRGRIEAVLDYAKVRGWREGENPARWRGHMDHLLARPGRVRRVRHHAAVPWQELPALMIDLGDRSGIAALAVRFAILTAARSGEVRGATWREIDQEGAAWTIPATRMKAGREHRVPLSAPALVLMYHVRPLAADQPGALVFPGMDGRPLSDMSLTAVLRRMGRSETAHGFRSSFRDWAADTGQPGDLAEAALAHVVGSKTEAAYRRGDLFERRRALMDAWADWVSG